MISHAMPNAGAPARAQHIGGDSQSRVYRDRERDSLSARANGDVHSDQFAVDVQQGAAGVAWVDRGIRLNQTLVRHVLIEHHVALDGTDDSDRDRMLIA